MDLGKALGFSLQPVQVDPDGASTPPAAAPLAPPSSKPAAPDSWGGGRVAGGPLQATRMEIEGLDQVIPTLGQAGARPSHDPPLGEEDDEPAPPSTTNEQLDAEELASLPQPLLGRWAAGLGRVLWAHRGLLLAAMGSSALAFLLLMFFLPDHGVMDEAARAPGADEPLTPRQLAALSDPPPPSGASLPPPSQNELPRAALGFNPEAAELSNVPAAAPMGAPAQELDPATIAALAGQEDPWLNAPTAAAGPCVRQSAPERIASGIDAEIPIAIEGVPNSVKVLLGYGLSPEDAVGLSVNATSLQSEIIFSQNNERALLGVVPKVVEHKPKFIADRAGIGGHREWRTLPGPADLALARTNRGLHLIRPNDYRTVSLWPVRASEELSRAHISSGRDRFFAFAFRRGGARGEVVLGWLDAVSLRRSDLVEEPFIASEVGIPSVAVRRRRALVAAAVRDNDQAPWRVELSLSRWGHNSRRIDVPEINHDSLSRTEPYVTSLDRNRWLVQWNEHEGSRTTIKFLTLDDAFEPLGKPAALSLPQQATLQPLAVAVDRGLFALYAVRSGKDRTLELWGASLACD